MSSRRDDELADLLGELETTLEALREELRDGPPGRRDGRFRPPTPREVLRFTEEYTIPTTIAVLEANIRALELLQRVLRYADPERAARESASRTGDRMNEVRKTATRRLERALSELETALSESDLPTDPESRSIIEDAQSLVDDIEARIEDGRQQVGDRRPDRRRDAVRIEVQDESTADEQAADDRDATSSEPADDDARVDIEAELESIKEEVDEERTAVGEPAGADEAGASDNPDEAGAGNNADESESSDDADEK